MQLTHKTILVSGGNRGIGAATVRELLKHNVAKIYVGARNLNTVPEFNDARVVPVHLDITDEASVSAVAAAAQDADIIINNAGTAGFANVLTASNAEIAQDFNANLYGTLNMMRAFAPQLVAKKSGAIVNIISVVGLVAAPALSGYSASKAALFSVTQSARIDLAGTGVEVLGVFPGPIDTDLARDLPMDKATPESAAAKIVAGITAGDLYIFPDPIAEFVGATWSNNAIGLEAAFNESRTPETA